LTTISTMEGPEEIHLKRALASTLVRGAPSEPIQIAILAREYNIPRTVLQRHFRRSKSTIHKYIKSNGMVNEKGGRPKLLLEDEKQRLLNKISDLNQIGKSPRSNEVKEMVRFFQYL